jgi:putative peptidoglycan lipid II flippase
MKHNLLRASIAISAATIFLRLLGFLREVALAAAYGASTVSDAFVIAMTVPSIVLAMISGTVAAAYIPQYVSNKGDKNQFTGNLLTLLFLVAFVFAVIFAIFPQALVYVFASGISPESFGLASMFLRMMVWSAIPLLLAGILRAYLQIKALFFVAMISDALINLFAVISILGSKMTGSLTLMGIGAVVGNTASMLMLVFFCHRNGLRYRPRLALRDERIRSMFRLMLPLMFSSAVLEINQIVDKNLASALVSGTVSSLNYAVKINNVITALVGAAIVTALFPKMSELAAENDLPTLKKHLITCINNLLPLLLPLTVGIVLMAQPIIRILLERGAFVPEDTLRTAECLQMYAIGLLAANLSPLLARAFHAMRQTKLPAILSAVSVAVGIALNLLLIGPLQHRGLALATSVSNTLCLILLLFTLRKQIGALGLRPQLGEMGKTALATAVMGLFVVIAMRFCPILTGSYAQCLLWTVLIAGAGAVLYGALLLLLRVQVVWKLIRRFFPKSA